MSSSSSMSKPVFVKSDRVAGWTVKKEIGSGGFGSVYEVDNNGQRAAMKTEFVYEDKKGELPNEVKQLRLLQFSQHFCRLFMACQSVNGGHTVNVMIMQLVGKNLSSLRRSTPQHHFTSVTAFRLAKQCLRAIQDMHSVGLLHRDIKSSNFAWSAEERLVYLLDLGFCRRFIKVSEDGVIGHRVARKKAPYKGTAKYASIHSQNREEQGRRDDLWSWLYMTVEMIKGKLKWDGRGEHMQVVIKEKIGSRLLDGCPKKLVPIYDHIRNLKYESRPDYELLHRKLDDFLAEKDVTETDAYDFEKGGKYWEHCQQENDAKTIRPPEDVLDQEPRLATWSGYEDLAHYPLD